MRKFTCPGCSNRTIPMFSKLMLGPSSTVTCGACSARLSVAPVRAGLFLLPFMLGALYTNIMTSIPVGLGILGLGFAITFSLWCRHLPLVVKEEGGPVQQDKQDDPLPETAG